MIAHKLARSLEGMSIQEKVIAHIAENKESGLAAMLNDVEALELGKQNQS